MSIDWYKEAVGISDEIIENRRELHSHPELGNHEFMTASFIENKLNSYGIKTCRMLDTAVIGILEGDDKGDCIALRADMDALPVTETTGCDFSSQNAGLMHACGHDVHMSAVLGAARLLSMHRSELKGSVKFIFQPDEEGSGGADRLIKEGVLNDVNAVFGAHVSPDLPLGTVGIRYGKFYAASDVYKVILTGKSSHGAEPQKGIDALYAASKILCALHELPSELAPERAVITTGILNSGTAVNIVPGKAVFEGIIRTLGADSRAYIKRRFQEIINNISNETGVSAEIIIKESYPGVVNTDNETLMAENSAKALFGDDKVIRIEEPTMTTEDFGYYINASKGCFYHIGTGGSTLHSSDYLPDESAPVLGAALHAEVVYDYLSKSES